MSRRVASPRPSAVLPGKDANEHERRLFQRRQAVALLEGVAHAPILTPDGLLQGLEMVRMIPAAMGGDRTTLSFGPYDHKGHKGMDNMVVRRLTKGQLVMEGRFAPPVG